MHARDLVDVAGLVALNGPLLACGNLSPAHGPLEQYWSTSKCRFEGWSQRLRYFAELPEEPTADDTDCWIEVRAALDEIFVSEILTRVWSAILVLCDRRAKTNLAEPIARSVMSTHVEARHRALALLVHGSGVGVKQAAAVNRLRRRAERWSDMLVGGLWHLGDVAEFAVDAERAADFAVDLADRRNAPGGAQAWRLVLASMRSAFQSGLSPIAASPDANARITASILGCFPADLFDSTGIFQSLWMMRLAAHASDAQGMIDDLLQSNLPVDRSQPRLQLRRRR